MRHMAKLGSSCVELRVMRCELRVMCYELRGWMQKPWPIRLADDYKDLRNYTDQGATHSLLRFANDFTDLGLHRSLRHLFPIPYFHI